MDIYISALYWSRGENSQISPKNYLTYVGESYEVRLRRGIWLTSNSRSFICCNIKVKYKQLESNSIHYSELGYTSMSISTLGFSTLMPILLHFYSSETKNSGFIVLSESFTLCYCYFMIWKLFSPLINKTTYLTTSYNKIKQWNK